MSLPTTLKLLRESKQWSQEDVAEKLNISPKTYSRFERGETKLIHDKLEKLAEIYQIKLSDLISVSDGEKMVIINGGTISGVFSEQHYTEGNGNVQNTSQQDVEYLKEKLELKEQIIAQQASEIQTLKRVIELLEEKLSQLNR